MKAPKMEFINPMIALNGCPNSPYTVSFTVQIADQSVRRTYKVSDDVAINFSIRHNIEMPDIVDPELRDTD